MRGIIALTVAATLVAGCGDGHRQQAQQVQSIKVRSAEQDQLFKLNPLNRAIALKRAIYDSGYRCQRITRSGFVFSRQARKSVKTRSAGMRKFSTALAIRSGCSSQIPTISAWGWLKAMRRLSPMCMWSKFTPATFHFFMPGSPCC